MHGSWSRRKRGVAALALASFGLTILCVGTWALLQDWSWSFPLVMLLVLAVVATLVAYALLIFFFYVSVQEIRGVDPPGVASDDESGPENGI